MDKTERRSAAPTFGQALPVWAQIGVLSFGGPAGQIALMHRMLVEERRWIGEERFLHALNFCMLLPGPEAMQLATYIGWTLHGTLGGLAAGLLFVLPGALVVLSLSLAYVIFGDVPLVEAAFVGIKAAVLVIVIEALLRVAKRSLRRPLDWGIAAAAFLALFFFDLPFPLVIVAAAAIGYGFAEKRENASLALAAANSVKVAPAQTFRTALLWLAIWIGPLLLLAAIFGRTHVLTDASIFFSKLAIVTFGGAYSVLAYMAQQAVATYSWLTPGEMLDGLGLAETTPGPLILVTEFVGFLAGYREGGEPRLLFGLLGAAVALWATFAPCFLWIFVGAPYIDRLGASARLRGSLAAVTAAVVGVILNLSLWFALHVLFAKVDAVWYGPLRLWQPELASLDTKALLLGALSAVLLLKVKLGIGGTLAAAAASALAWHLIVG